MSLEESVAASRLDGLKALREVLAREIEAGPMSDRVVSQTAALARQLRDVLKDIEELEKSVRKGSIVDDLARRRATRGSGSAGDLPAVGSGSE